MLSIPDIPLSVRGVLIRSYSGVTPHWEEVIGSVQRILQTAGAMKRNVVGFSTCCIKDKFWAARFKAEGTQCRPSEDTESIDLCVRDAERKLLSTGRVPLPPKRMRSRCQRLAYFDGSIYTTARITLCSRTL